MAFQHTRMADGAAAALRDEKTLAATGKLSEAVEWVERARGHLYGFHQLIGRADFLFEDAADLLEQAGEGAWAQAVRSGVVGRNVIAGRWTFQIVEDFDSDYWSCVRDMRQRICDEFTEGRLHAFEAHLKEQRRTAGRPHHEADPAELGERQPNGTA